MLPHKTIEQRLQSAVKAILPDADTSQSWSAPAPTPNLAITKATL